MVTNISRWWRRETTYWELVPLHSLAAGEFRADTVAILAQEGRPRLRTR